MPSGGYRRPASPAPVSGPGALARRTDGGNGEQTVAALPDAQYGEGAAFRQSQQAAPLSASASRPPPVGFADKSTRPGEPVTAGIDMGDGPGSEAVTAARTGSTGSPIADALSKLAAVDPTGGIAQLLMEAQRRGV